MPIYLWLIESLFLVIMQTEVLSKYIFVFEHCRHGARGLSKLNEKGKDYIGEEWIGDSELSSVGLRQHYLLGARIRNKYKELLSDVYNQKEVIVFATNSNRTIMSALAQLQGIYRKNAINNTLSPTQKDFALPPFNVTDKRVLDHIKSLGDQPLPNFIQSVPIHIMSPKEKVFQFEKSDGCPPMKRLRKENENKTVFADYVKQFNASYGEKMLAILNKKDKDTFAKLKNVGKLASAFVFDYIDGRKLKKFTEAGIDLDEFYSFCSPYPRYHSVEGQAGDPEGKIALSSSSVLLRHILSHIDRRIEADISQLNERDVPKFVLLSAHDSTVVSLDDLFRLLFGSPTQYPSFASNQIIEITRDDAVQAKSWSDYRIKILFNDNEKLSMNYKQFRETVLGQVWTLEETGKFCGFIEETGKEWKAATYALIPISAVMLIALIVMIIFKCRYKPEVIENKPLVQ